MSRSLEFNLKSRVFNELFPELRKEAEEEVLNCSEDEDGDHDIFHHPKAELRRERISKYYPNVDNDLLSKCHKRKPPIPR